MTRWILTAPSGDFCELGSSSSAFPMCRSHPPDSICHKDVQQHYHYLSFYCDYFDHRHHQHRHQQSLLFHWSLSTMTTAAAITTINLFLCVLAALLWGQVTGEVPGTICKDIWVQRKLILTATLVYRLTTVYMIALSFSCTGSASHSKSDSRNGWGTQTTRV